MKDTVEYQLFIGCNDSQLNKELITVDELIEGISLYFKREKINFSILRTNGGYSNKKGWYITENS